MNTAAALRRAAGLLVEPAPMTHPVPAVPLEVVVTALSAGAGATTVCRGLAIALRRLHGVEVAAVGASGAVAAGPGTAVLCDVPPDEIGSVRQRGPGRSLVAVADGRHEPQLAALVSAVLAQRNERVVLVANRARGRGAWVAHGALCVPESRLGAMLVARGRRAPGPMGASFEGLAARLQPPAATPSGTAREGAT